MRTGLPKRVYLKHGAYFYVDLSNKWHRLCGERDGLPAVFRALAKLIDKVDAAGSMPQAVTSWLEDPQNRKWSAATRKLREASGNRIAAAFQQFHCSEVTTPDVYEFLNRWSDKPRFYNVIRNDLSRVLKHAAVMGWREGHNPVDNIKGQSTPGRKRMVSDADISAVRAAIREMRYGAGLMNAMDLALLTGQRIGDVRSMRWQDVKPDGIHITQGKTGASLVVGWSADLRKVVARCAEGGSKIGHLVKTQTGSGYTHSGINSAWKRALEKAKVNDLHIHDLRGRAGIDKAAEEGKEAAQALLGHSTMKMTEHYIEGKTIKKTRANSLPKDKKQ